MKVILMNLAATAALATTAVLLVADSGGVKECHQAAQEVTFDVGHNTCGEPGILRVSTPERECSLDVEVEERTGLPETGDVYEGTVDIRQGNNWFLTDTDVIVVGLDGGTQPNDGGVGHTTSVYRSCEVLREGEVLRLKCTARRADLVNEPVRTCEAVLTPR
ncbi:hypothetical protein ACLEPN_09020 [Myxococcus sp. 1LA]